MIPSILDQMKHLFSLFPSLNWLTWLHPAILFLPPPIATRIVKPCRKILEISSDDGLWWKEGEGRGGELSLNGWPEKPTSELINRLIEISQVPTLGNFRNPPVRFWLNSDPFSAKFPSHFLCVADEFHAGFRPQPRAFSFLFPARNVIGLDVAGFQFDSLMGFSLDLPLESWMLDFDWYFWRIFSPFWPNFNEFLVECQPNGGLCAEFGMGIPTAFQVCV